MLQHVSDPTKATYGRSFWRCSLPPQDPNRCSFFAWSDRNVPPNAPVSSSSRVLQTPLPKSFQALQRRVRELESERDHDQATIRQLRATIDGLVQELGALRRRVTYS